MRRSKIIFMAFLMGLLSAQPLYAFVPRNPLSITRPTESGLSTVSFGLDLAALTSSITNEAGACVSRRLRDIPNRTVTETDITGGQTVSSYPPRAYNPLRAFVSSCEDIPASVSRPDGVLVSIKRAQSPRQSRGATAILRPLQSNGVRSGIPRRNGNRTVLDVLGRPVSVRHVINITYKSKTSGQTLASFGYTRDATGLVTQKVSIVNGTAATNSYAYDALGRLTAAGGAAYTYDAAGNRNTQAGGGVPSISFSYQHNRLAAMLPFQASVLHDGAGNVRDMFVFSYSSSQRLSLAWDSQGRLASVKTNNVFAESYAYDPLGRRLSTTTGTNTVYHVYDGDHCAADVNASGQPLRVYTWGPGVDNLLAVTLITGGVTNIYYAVKDHLGSVHALIDASGNAAATYTYDAWGNVLSATINYSLLTVNSLRYLWQGREYSFATGLTNFRARWYSPELGRWLSPDPIGLEGGLNLYEAFVNNPVNYRDPSGLWGIQFGSVNLGYGDPWLAFDSDSWGDLGRGAAAGVDGMIPFFDPLTGVYADDCGNVDDMYKVSRHIGGLTRDTMIAVAIPNIGTWIKNPILYEIGSTTVSPRTWEAIQGMTVIDRGKYLANMANGNYWRAALEGLNNLGQFTTTVGTGLTPGANLLVLGAFEAVDYQTR
jgi:RHS repeat-associated protein